MNINNVRKLAKDNRYINLFSASKEINGIKLFKNETDFTKIQNLFLNYLYFYSNIHMDIALNKVSERILDSEIYEDAYNIWKNKSKDNQEKIDNKPHDVHIVFGK